MHLRARLHSGPIRYVEPAVNRQPGFRRELVEQITSFIIRSQNFLDAELIKYKFRDPGVFLPFFMKIRKFHDFFNILVSTTQSC